VRTKHILRRETAFERQTSRTAHEDANSAMIIARSRHHAAMRRYKRQAKSLKNEPRTILGALARPRALATAHEHDDLTRQRACGNECGGNKRGRRDERGQGDERGRRDERPRALAPRFGSETKDEIFSGRERSRRRRRCRIV
jgi:hypothetical protein